MNALSYQQAGLILKKGGTSASKQQIQDLQQDIRSLGYLRNGIDGIFGSGTQNGIMGLQYDLLHNEGKSTGGDGNSHLKMIDYNRGRITQITGEVDQALVGCIVDMLNDPAFPKLPFATDPVTENQKVVSKIASTQSKEVPMPFIIAILKQESNLQHFIIPKSGDKDSFIVVGLDTNNSKQKIAITSRGYGVGQYTLFHHPARLEEVNDFMLDPVKNLQKAIKELRNKYDQFVIGPSSKADDRIAEIGTGPLRICKYPSTDPHYLKDCKNCLLNAGLMDIKSGVTPLYDGSKDTFVPTQYYATASYQGVPIVKKIGCDWPYAVRRYNGAGINSYHYKVLILKHLLALKVV